MATWAGERPKLAASEAKCSELGAKNDRLFNSLRDAESHREKALRLEAERQLATERAARAELEAIRESSSLVLEEMNQRVAEAERLANRALIVLGWIEAPCKAAAKSLPPKLVGTPRNVEVVWRTADDSLAEVDEILAALRQAEETTR